MTTLSATSLRRLVRALAFASLLTAIAAGGALADPPGQSHDYFAQIQAGVRPDDRAGIRGPSSLSLAVQASTETNRGVRPDDRAGIRGVASPAALTRPAPASDGTGFDWADAGIGAGAAFALMLLGAGVALLGLRRRRHAGPESAAAPAFHS